MNEEQRTQEDDIGNNYLERRKLLHELNSPAMDLLNKYGSAIDTRKPEPEKKTVAPEKKEVKEKSAEPLEGAEEAIEADPWIDPIAAFSGGFAGMGKTAISQGVKLLPALGRALLSGTVGAVADIPLGAATEKVAGKYPKLAFPFALATGMVSGMTIESAIEKSVIKALGKKATPKLIKSTVEKVKGNLETGKIEDDITGSVVEDLNKSIKPKKGDEESYREYLNVLLEEVNQGEVVRIPHEEGGYRRASTYPEFMQKKKWTGKDVAHAIELELKGEKLGSRQQEMVDAALSEAKSRWETDFEGWSKLKEERAFEESKIFAGDLKIGDEIEIPGDQLKVTNIDDDVVTLKDGQTLKISEDRFLEGAKKIKPSELSPDQLKQIELMGDSTKPLLKIMQEAEPKAKLFLETDVTDLPEKAININFSRIESADDVKAVLAKTAKIYGAEIQTARRGEVSNLQTQKLAGLLNLSPEQLLTRRKGQAFNATEAVAARKLLISSGETLLDMSKKIALGEATDVDKFAFQKMFATHYAIQAQVSGMTAEAGRALQSFKIMARSTEGKLKQMKSLMEQMRKGPATPEELAEMVSKLDTAEGLNRFVKDANKANAFDMVIEAWINGLLCGPQTHAVNTMSNSLVALWQMPERLLASGISKAMPGKQEVFAGEALNQAYGLVEGFKDGMKAFGKTMVTGEPSDSLSKIETRRFRAITGVNVGFDEGGIAATAVDLLGEGVRMPGRLLMAEDEFFKGIGYRMELRSRAFRQAKAEGLKGDDMAKRMQDIINEPPDDIQLAAINAMHYQTFTKELGTAGKAFQKILNEIPALRFIVPFVRTPTNIIKFAGERTPLAFISKNVRADIAAGGARRDLALARISLGSMVMASTATLTAEGLVTGGGPSDAAMRNIKRNTGWQPYSIKIGNKYYSYSRLEPLGMLLGLSADMTEIMGQLTQDDAEKLASYSVMAFSKNVTSKTWLRGVSELFNVMEDPDRYGKRYIERFVGSAIPTGIAQAERVIDPDLRAVYGIMDEMKSRIPGFSKGLFPRRNIWGEPVVLQGGLGPDIVSPIYTSTEKESPIDEELLRLNVPIKMPRKTQSIHGEPIELEPKEYDRLLVEMNTIKLPQTGKNLKDSLDYLVTRDPTYKETNDDRKEMMIRAYITQAKEMARHTLYEEMPDISWLVDESRNRKMLSVQ